MQSVSEWVQERLKAVTQRTTKAWKTINRESTPKAIVIINLRELWCPAAYLHAIWLTFYEFLPLVLSVKVTTKDGDIGGFSVDYSNMSTPFKLVNKFLGIPLTAPVTGGLRYKTPQPPVHWRPSVCQAEIHGNVCFQPKRFEFPFDVYSLNFVCSKDCLYLDVYTPNVSMSFPAMVYIHGGSYETGSPFIHPSDILALQGVVVVVIQYRPGPFGFLTIGDSVSSGNYGMLDQVEKLKCSGSSQTWSILVGIPARMPFWRKRRRI